MLAMASKYGKVQNSAIITLGERNYS